MAYDFNGTNQFFNSPAPIGGLTKPFTLACWFNPNNITSNLILITLSPNNGQVWSLYAGGAIAGDPVVAVQTGAVTDARTTSGYTGNNWNHACGVFTSNISRTAYLNGGNSATNTVPENLATTATQLQIGTANLLGSNILYMNGSIAEVGIWNAALTPAEIASLAKGMTPDKIRPQSLVFYAPLVRDLIDQQGGLVITNNNAATVANHPRVYA